jgi:uncharacterized membrane protein YdcZ (DUF606 family)
VANSVVCWNLEFVLLSYLETDIQKVYAKNIQKCFARGNLVANARTWTLCAGLAGISYIEGRMLQSGSLLGSVIWAYVLVSIIVKQNID